MSKFVYATQTFAAMVSEGNHRVVREGERFDADDPLVKDKRFRWAFTTEAAIEQATARPGEQRTTRRGE